MTDDRELPNDAATSARPSRLPTVLIVIATLVAVASVLTTWVRVQMLDTDQWVATSDELLADPEVQSALSTYLSNELYEQVDIESELQSLLPDSLGGLAGPLAGAARSTVTDGIDRLVASQRFAELWSAANRVAHERFVAILKNETRPGIDTSDGTVTIDLGPLVRSVGETMGIPDSALDRIPADAGQVTVFESGRLADVQTSVQILNFLSWFLFVVVFGLYALAVFLARDAWRRALVGVGAGLVVGGIVLLFARAIGIRIGVDSIVGNPVNKPLGEVVAAVGTELIRQLAWIGIVYGVLIMAFTWLLGERRWAVAIRRQLGSTSESAAAVGGVALLGVLALVWWSPGRSFDHWSTALLLIGLVVAGVVVFFRQVAEEQRVVDSAPQASVPLD
ncbi:MAG: hypothetical protein WBP59_02790 [Ilumatobacteraceae bacterium]